MTDIMPGRATTFWHIFFGVAAAYNFLIGAAGFMQPGASTDMKVINLLVFCFGILYALLARDPLRYAPALWAGIVGKLGVVVLLGLPNWREGGDPLIGTIVAGDLVFALGFIAFLFGAARR